MEPVPHDEVIPQLAEHLRPMFDSSPGGVYIWLAEGPWTCHETLGGRFGCSVEELENAPGFLQRLCHEDDQGVISWNYWNRVQALAFPVTLRFRGVRKDGSVFGCETDMIPMTYGGHTIAYHFVRNVEDRKSNRLNSSH